MIVACNNPTYIASAQNAMNNISCGVGPELPKLFESNQQQKHSKQVANLNGTKKRSDAAWNLLTVTRVEQKVLKLATFVERSKYSVHHDQPPRKHQSPVNASRLCGLHISQNT
eukprot:5301293-Amphidinium_carterae.1